MAVWYKIAFYPRIGRGLKAIKTIPKGTIILRSPVVVVPKHEIRPNGVLAHYVFKFGSQVAIALGDASLLNHETPSNCDYWPDIPRRQIVIRANKNIPANSQLTIDYGWTEPHFRIGEKPMAAPRGKIPAKANTDTNLLRALANRLSANLGIINKEKAEWNHPEKEKEMISPLHHIFANMGMRHHSTLVNEHGDKQYHYAVPSGEIGSQHHESETRLNKAGYIKDHEELKPGPISGRSIKHSHYRKGNSHVTLFSHGKENRVSGARHSIRNLKTTSKTMEIARERPRLRFLKEAPDHKFTSEFYKRYIHARDFSLFPQLQQDLDDLISEYRSQGVPAIEDRMKNDRENQPTPEQLQAMNPADIIATSPTIPQTAMALTSALNYKK